MVTDPDKESRRRAVGIGHRDQEKTASVIAKGYGDLAEQIIEKAHHHGIYVHESEDLVNLLMNLDIDERIPARLYDVLGEILNWMGEMDHPDNNETDAEDTEDEDGNDEYADEEDTPFEDLDPEPFD